MTTYGYGINKGKREVYTKEEADVRYVLRDNLAIINGTLKPDSGRPEYWIATLTYPSGFTQNNSVVTSVMVKGLATEATAWSCGSVFNTANTLAGEAPIAVRLKESEISLSIRHIVLSKDDYPSIATANGNMSFKLVLMKHEVLDSEYTLGDVNGDGVIDSQDLNLLSGYIQGTNTLTEQQIKAADINKDGILDTADVNKLNQYILGNIDSLE